MPAIHTASTTTGDEPTAAGDGLACRGAEYVMIELEETTGGAGDTVDVKAWVLGPSGNWSQYESFGTGGTLQLTAGQKKARWLYIKGATRFDLELDANASGGGLTSFVTFTA